MALPPEIQENRSDEREVFALINALRRQSTTTGGGAPLGARYWVSTADAQLTNEVDMGALGSGLLYQVSTAGVAVPGIVTVGTSLTFSAGTLTRSPLTGDVTAAANSNTTAFRSFAARSVLANATAAAGVPTELSSGTDGFVLRQSGTTLSFGTLGAASIPALDATFITQTPNANLANEQALSALVTGVLSSTTATGVVASTAFTTGSIPFGASSILSQDNANFFWDNTNKRLGIRTSSPSYPLEVTDTGLGTSTMRLDNTTSGGFMYISKGATGIGGIGASGTWLGSGATDVAFGAYTGARMEFYTNGSATASATINTNGTVDLSSLAASGVVYATVTSGKLKIGTAAEVAAAITWPAAALILISSGTTTAPIGQPGFLYDVANDLLELSDSQGLAHYNLGGLSAGNYERVRAIWSGNVWTLKSEEGGTGTVRAMTIDADTAALSLLGDGGVTITGSTSFGVTASGVSVTAQQISNAANYMTVQATYVGFGSSPTVASAAVAVADVIRLEPDVTVSGSTTIVDPFCGVTVRAFQINSASADVTNAATLRIEGDATISGGAALGSGYSLWVAGRTRQVGEFISLADTLLGGGGSNVGFFGSAGAAKQAPTGSRGGNAALASLLTALAAYGLITDSTSA
jgi:hypothetical protein